MKKTVIGSIALVVLTIGCIELSCYGFFSIFYDRFTFFDPQSLVFDETKLARAAKVFDPELGWVKPYSTPYGERPRAKKFPTTLLATFGDSYTHCDQVNHDETYQHFLSKRLGADVLNFGVGGYGTDQALLRFQRVFPKLKTPLVSIGLITENINRIVNVYRKFYYPKTALSLTKPRFVLMQDQTLKLIPNPIQSVAALQDLTDPNFISTLGEHDYWYNRDQYPIYTFPYSSILFNKRLWLELLSQSEEEIIDDSNPRPWEKLWENQEARTLLFSILDTFVAEAKQFGATPLILLSPRKREVYRSFRGEQLVERDILLQYCTENHYYCFDGISALTQAADSEAVVRSYFSGHLTRKGNKVFAKKLAKFLEKNDLTSASKQ